MARASCRRQYAATGIRMEPAVLVVIGGVSPDIQVRQPQADLSARRQGAGFIDHFHAVDGCGAREQASRYVVLDHQAVRALPAEGNGGPAPGCRRRRPMICVGDESVAGIWRQVRVLSGAWAIQDTDLCGEVGSGAAVPLKDHGMVLPVRRHQLLLK